MRSGRPKTRSMSRNRRARKKQAGLNALLTGFGADYVKPAREGRAYGTCRLQDIRDVYPDTEESGPKKIFAGYMYPSLVPRPSCSPGEEGLGTRLHVPVLRDVLPSQWSCPPSVNGQVLIYTPESREAIACEFLA